MCKIAIKITCVGYAIYYYIISKMVVLCLYTVSQKTRDATLLSLLQQMLTVGHCEFFSVASVNSFLSPNRMKITSFSKCFKQSILARQFASISAPAGVSSNTSNQDRGENKWSVRHQIVLFNALNGESVAGLIALVPAHLPQSHSLQYAHVWSALGVLSADADFE